MQDLHRTLSVHLEIWGTIDEPATFLDLAHSLAASDIGQSHGGHTSEGDLVDAVRQAFVGSTPLDLYGPTCNGRTVVERLLPALVDAGLSVRARFWNSVPAGYRYESTDALTRVIVATPGGEPPRRLVMSGSAVLAPLDAFESAVGSGDPLVFVEEIRALAFGRDEPIELSTGMIEWLGLDPETAPGP